MVLYDENFEEIRRLSDPAEDPCSRPNTPIDPSSLVVYIDGACRGNGTASARASYGVFFGPGSPHNAKGTLSDSIP
jgi:hypothetical protein